MKSMTVSVFRSKILFTGVFLLIGIGLLAELKVPELTGRVVDKAGLLSPDGRNRVNGAIILLENATGGQVTVLAIPSLDGGALEDFSMKVAEKWKIGKKGKDNGAILLIVKNDRKIRLELGYGWEGPINDAKVGDIIREMGKFFKKGEYDDGVVFAVNKIQQFVTGIKVDGIPSSGKSAKNEKAPVPHVVIIFIIIVVMVLISQIFGGRRTYRNRRSGGGGFFWGSGGGGGSFGGGSFSGGGGGFGGGGASGGW
ncbi:MAG: hypothetical protein A2017_09365 [Lentisphaerae bacterium GWF2_44_16]|nr:MAG: hypothetical protein A2017_09365 [Lentisphaerae bacterium GWF2_44_16]